MGSLSHLRVLDLSRVLAGPWASQIFADLGAEVIKIERPGGGDDTRSWGPPWMPDAAGNQSDSSAYYLCTNRGKHSLAVALSDIMTGLYGTIGTLAALAERERSGLGQHVDVALLDVTLATLSNQAANYVIGGVTPQRIGNAHASIVPYQSFETLDGHIVVAVGNDSQFCHFCEVLELTHLATDTRFVTNEARVLHRDELIPLLAERIASRASQHWLVGFEARNVPAGPINTIAEAFEQPQVAAREMLVNVPHPDNPALRLVGSPIKLSRTPVIYDRPPPRLGEDNSLLEMLTAPRVS